MYKVPNDWKLGNFMELSEDEKLKWLYNESTEAMEKAEEGSLPEVSSSDNGKLLGVSGGEWDVVDAPSSLPDVTYYDNGKVLGVQSGVWVAMEDPSSLPTVTSSDNGDILTVVNGSWAKATPTGGAKSFVVNYLIDWDDQTQSSVITCNKTIEEIETAASEGKAIDARLFYYTQDNWLVPIKIAYGLPYYYVFDYLSIDPSNDGLSYVQIWYNSNQNKWEFLENYFTLTPYVPQT